MLKYFNLEELVCPHVHDRFGPVAWQFFNPRLLIMIETMRDRIGKPVLINNWHELGKFDERGLRCIQCSIVKKAIATDTLYLSPHITGQAVDFDVQGLVAEEVRQWLIKNKNWWPYPIRLEEGTSWVHLDVRDGDQGKVYVFKP